MSKGNWRDDLDNAMFDILAKAGPETFIRVAKDMLEVKPKVGENPTEERKRRAQVRGEVAEIVLLGWTRQYLLEEKCKGMAFHSVVLKNLGDVQSDFRTELDFVLVTPYFMLTTECKSYYGDVRITDMGTLTHSGNSTDVYKQSRLHHTHLMKYAQQFALPNLGLPRLPVYANGFLFSNSKVSDVRTKERKTGFRILTVGNIVPYYDAMFKKFKKPVFDYDHACAIFGKCAASVKLHQQHKAFLGYKD